MFGAPICPGPAMDSSRRRKTEERMFLALHPLLGQDPLIHEVSRSHTNDTPQSLGFRWTSDHIVAETST